MSTETLAAEIEAAANKVETLKGATGTEFRSRYLPVHLEVELLAVRLEAGGFYGAGLIVSAADDVFRLVTQASHTDASWYLVGQAVSMLRESAKWVQDNGD